MLKISQDSIGAESLKIHSNLKGKLEIKSKIKLDSKEALSLAYTPGVAEVSRKIAEDNSKVYEYTIKSNTVAVISDGSAVLGLGNIGPEAAIPVMEGKSILFKELAGINAFPICLKEQNTEKTIETIKNISPVFGGINLEDFKAPECFEIESALQNLGIPVMHDDQHGTAVVVLAGLLNAIKVKKISKEEARIVINGAGAAGIAIFKLLRSYGFKKIIMVDSKGIICKARTDLNTHKKEAAEFSECTEGGLEHALNNTDIFIGVSKGNILTKEMIKKMNSNPIIFAMANPIPEIMPDEAKEAGAFIVATGRSDFPNQINNVLAFPGIFKGALEVRATRITEKMKIAAAETLASLVSNPTKEKIIPEPLDKNIPIAVAGAVKKAWLKEKL